MSVSISNEGHVSRYNSWPVVCFARLLVNNYKLVNRVCGLLCPSPIRLATSYCVSCPQYVHFQTNKYTSWFRNLRSAAFLSHSSSFLSFLLLSPTSLLQPVLSSSHTSPPLLSLPSSPLSAPLSRNGPRKPGTWRGERCTMSQQGPQKAIFWHIWILEPVKDIWWQASRFFWHPQFFPNVAALSNGTQYTVHTWDPRGRGSAPSESACRKKHLAHDVIMNLPLLTPSHYNQCTVQQSVCRLCALSFRAIEAIHCVWCEPAGYAWHLIALIMSSAIQTQLRAWLGREIGRPDTQ